MVVAYGMWDLPGPGIEPVSPALAGGFLSTVPPGKPPKIVFFFNDTYAYYFIDHAIQHMGF